MRGAYIATTIAEYFQAQGKKGAADDGFGHPFRHGHAGGRAWPLGNLPPPKGIHPSVFAALPKLLERTGNFPRGSITGLYTVLVEGDDFNEPISDAMRSILDGHIVLSRDLAAGRIYPPIDVLASASRVMTSVTDKTHQILAAKFKEALATLSASRKT